jgi:nucleoside-triphosphatase THEP1
MIWLISGEIDSGKTSRILEIYRQKTAGQAGGFISRKVYQDNIFRGYEIVRLPDGPRMPLARLGPEKNQVDKVCLDKRRFAESSEAFPYGQFIFSQAGFLFGENIILELLSAEAVRDIFIDEIGPLELQGRGFCRILLKALQSGKNLYISVRTSCLQAFLEKFNIEEYTIIFV